MTKQEKIDWLSAKIAKPDCEAEMRELLSESDDSFINQIYKRVKEFSK